MDAKEFLEIFDHTRVLQIYKTIFGFFSQPLPQDFDGFEEFDLGFIIMETKGKLEDAHQFDRALEFIDILEKNHPDLHIEFFDSLDNLRVEYHCFHNNPEGISNGLKNFIKYPYTIAGHVLDNLYKVAFHQYTDVLDAATRTCFDNLDIEKNEYSDAYNLAYLIFNIELEKAYQTKNFDEEAMADKLGHYFNEVEVDDVACVQDGLFGEDDIQIKPKPLSQKIWQKNIFTLKYHFMKAMLKKGMHFYLSGHLWHIFMDLWQGNRLSKNAVGPLSDSFAVSDKMYKEHLTKLSGGMAESNITEMILATWGGVYVYDFLLEHQLIDEQTHRNFLSSTKMAKAKTIADYFVDGWIYGFIHKWEKPASVPSQEFEQEKIIFEKSYRLDNIDRTLEEKFPEQLAKLGDFGKMILKEERLQVADIARQKRKIALERERLEQNQKAGDVFYNTPITKDTKVGRNEPCPCGSGKKYKKCCGK